MILIGKSGDAQSARLRTRHNALPMHRHSDVRVSDVFERRMEISMLGADSNASPKILVGAAIIDGNHIATLQMRRDFVDPVERGLIKNRLINRPFDEHKLVAVESYQFLRSVTDQAYRHCVQQFVGKMDAREWFWRVRPLNFIAKRLKPPALLLF